MITMRFRWVFLWVFLLVFAATVPARALSLDGLDDRERMFLNGTVETLDPFVSRRRDEGTAPLITFEELYARASPAQAQFVRLEQPNLSVQYLPSSAYEAYVRMMEALEQDLGKHLLVESGYRSPAYQLYLFLFYMPKHAIPFWRPIATWRCPAAASTAASPSRRLISSRRRESMGTAGRRNSKSCRNTAG